MTTTDTESTPADPEERLAHLGVTLPAQPPAVGNSPMAVRHGGLLYLAGHAPLRDGRHRYVGRVGRDLTTQDGYEAARLTAVNMLATVKAELDDLRRVSNVVSLRGMVSCTDDFPDLSRVIDGATDLFAAVWGDRGRPARSALGVPQLPFGTAVQIEAIVAVDDDADRRRSDVAASSIASGAVEIQVTCGSAEEAATIAERLVDDGLAACVQSVPIASVYEWDGAVQHDEEVLLIVKTRAERFNRIAALATAMHSYELPAITMLPMGGTAAYLDWVEKQVRPR